MQLLSYKQEGGIPYWGAVGFLKGEIAVVVYRHGGKYFASSDLDLTRDQVLGLYSSRTGIEEVFRVLTVGRECRHVRYGLIGRNCRWVCWGFYGWNR